MPTPDPFDGVVWRVDPAARLVRSWPLAGGVSAEVTALEVARGSGEVEHWVVRRHGEADLRANPHIARDELRLLRIAWDRGLAVPEPIAADESGELLPTPYTISRFVDGEVDLDPPDLARYLRRLAEELARTHAVVDAAELGFLPRRGRGHGAPAGPLDESMGETRIRAALDTADPSPANPAALLHGDYWPGNVLWRDGDIAAVIDWEDAAVGDPLADVGNARLEILWWFGPDAMNAFTDDYLALAPARSRIALPYWDLVAALRPCGKLGGFGLDSATESCFRDRHARFVDGAIRALTPPL